jgi:hypothetical protein
MIKVRIRLKKDFGFKNMKKKQALLITSAITIGLLACNKSDPERPASIIGKWNEIGLHVNQTTNGVTKDTILKENAFTAADYAIFHIDQSAVFSRDLGSPHLDGANPYLIQFVNYRYNISGSTLTLIRTDLPTGQASDMSAIKIETIIQLDTKNLVLHDSFNDGYFKYSTDAYFVKK